MKRLFIMQRLQPDKRWCSPSKIPYALNTNHISVKHTSEGFHRELGGFNSWNLLREWIRAYDYIDMADLGAAFFPNVSHIFLRL